MKRPTFALEREGDRWFLVSRRELSTPGKMPFDALALRPIFTPTEEKILAMVLDMKANKEIAETLGCTVRTVKFHVSALLQKTGCATRFEIFQRFSVREVAEAKT